MGQGGQQRRPEAGRLIMPAMEAGWHVVDEGRIKPGGIRGYVDLALKAGWFLGRVLLIGLGLEPYWGKPDVRNLRGGAGNVDHGGTRNPPHNRKGADRKLSS
ncbi:MAG: hypothetical protein GTO12_12430 [Proteobacteria bacterium]|nr:hypothetical protein [Pseudomonadota bacterium]